MENKITIALVDDNCMVRNAIRHVLTLNGFEVIMEANNGKELIEKLKIACVLPDVCLMDISMPEMNGYEATRNVKAKWKSIKIIGFSSEAGEFIGKKMLEMGADLYLSKDVPVAELCEAIKSVR
jgi:DNA-binding NarL/FixJ family response regulator